MVTDITRYLQTWSAVGKDAPNLEEDVAHIQLLLRLAGRAGAPAFAINGKASPALFEAVASFQKEIMKISPDGKVEPASATFRALVDAASPAIEERSRFPTGNGHRGHLTKADYVQAATTLGCKPEAIMAVSLVESTGAPFLHSGKPRILFEPQLFGKLTNYIYDSLFPYVSRQHQLNRRKDPHVYGKEEEQWVKLKIATLIDRQAAIKSASWGRFQVLGENWAHTGARSLDAFLTVMFTSERSQLDGFVAFVKKKHLSGALKRLDWRAFAFGYNGPSYHRDNYDGKIAKRYRELAHAAAVAVK